MRTEGEKGGRAERERENDKFFIIERERESARSGRICLSKWKRVNHLLSFLFVSMCDPAKTAERLLNVETATENGG